ncbi:hypothetical protein OG436_29440 [Streptomyces caniferus]|uniref:hypothetical protein n=1 Tax=Streptomyces caniferus TaxID=285557 RepID=UPI002E27BF25|nr:hypothetical protein [Streptomyces caniferus]
MNLLRKLRDAVDHLCIRLYVAAQVMAVTEPVRLRAIITAAVALLPTLAIGTIPGTVAGILVSALVLVAGEDARSKVSPTEK